MKKIAFHVSNLVFGNNKMFELDDPILNRDNGRHQFYELRKCFKVNGYDLVTHDMVNLHDVDAVIYYNVPKEEKELNDNENNLLLFLESKHVRPDNYNLKRHVKYKRIFTNCDDFIDNERYYKVNYSYDIPISIPRNIENKTKEFALIAGNKSRLGKNSGLKARRNVLDWFEKYEPGDIDLYGKDWNKYIFPKIKGIRRLNRIDKLQELFGPNYSFYKGMIDSKYDILTKYKFSFTYENVLDIEGYITEKIFDSFFAGCVPVYRGASNIDKYIPENCFIDERKFNDYSKLHKYLKSMDDNQYKDYLNNIELFLNSDKSEQFRSSYFANVIVRETLKIINGDD
ncbi:MAG: glycosyltransferase family 10 [Spirochaetales bacterium]|nr:glycosyltransferase family 10 [Spirochaetales bacterium]